MLVGAIMPRICRTILVAMVTLCAIIAHGCEQAAPPAPSAQPVQVFATVHTLADLARQVGGKYVQVDFGIENGRSLLNLQPNPQIVQQHSAAQLVIAGGSEPWAIADATNPRAQGRSIRLDVILNQIRGHASSQPALPGTYSDDTEIGLEWLDPVVAQQTATELARRLTLIRPNHEVYFSARAKQFNEQVEALIGEYRLKFKAAPRRRVLSLTHEFDYLAQRFEIDVVPVIGKTVDRINDSDIGTLLRTSRQEHLTTLLIRADTPPALIDDLRKRSGLRLITMDPYGSSSAGGNSSYLELLRYNLEQLLTALQQGQ